MCMQCEFRVPYRRKRMRCRCWKRIYLSPANYSLCSRVHVCVRCFIRKKCLYVICMQRESRPQTLFTPVYDSVLTKRSLNWSGIRFLLFLSSTRVSWPAVSSFLFWPDIHSTCKTNRENVWICTSLGNGMSNSMMFVESGLMLPQKQLCIQSYHSCEGSCVYSTQSGWCRWSDRTSDW